MHERVIEAVRTALTGADLAPLEDVLAADARWYGNFPGGSCRTSDEVLATLRSVLDAGGAPRLDEVRVVGDRLLLSVDVAGSTVWVVVTLSPDGRIVELQDYSTAAQAEHDLALRGAEVRPPPSPVSDLVPFAHVADVERSIRFYRLLGFEPEDTYEPDGRPVWAALKSEDARVMVAEAEAPIDHREQAVLFYLYARDLEALRDHLVAHDVTAGEIVDGSPGPRREMRVTDPDGYCLMVAQVDDETIVRA